jgi:branched-chain amino acid transport system permease protein
MVRTVVFDHNDRPASRIPRSCLELKKGNFMRLKYVYPFVTLLLLILIPVVIRNQGLLHLCIVAMLYIVMTTTLQAIMETGQVSIGHSAFMAIGAYTSALLTKKLGFNFYGAFILSGVSAGLIAFLIGIPILRIKGFYFAIVTFGLCEFVRMVATNWVDIFGGANGITDIPWPGSLSLALFQISITNIFSYYYLVLGLMIVCLTVIWRIRSSFYAEIFKSISESNEYAESLGVNNNSFKVFVFWLGSAFAGMAGALYAHYMHYISPEAFSFSLSVEFIIMVIVGGRMGKYGPIIGSIFFVVVPEFLRGAKGLQELFFAICFLVVMFVLPGGLVSLRDKIFGQKAVFNK